MANFLEKVPYWVGVCSVFAQRQHDNEQENAAQTDETIN
jgi:hypothetical protein